MNPENSELLLPVGNYKMCLAAIHNGADAVYVGMPGFNARGRSHDHEFDELREIIDTCHLYGVKVNIAFNILIFQNEFEEALKTLDEVIALRPDAFIIQDIGLISLLRERYPDVVIHGSTQMTVTNHEAIELLEDLDIKRFVLGRENTLDEIRKIKEKTNRELEVFVHGALCVAYSGQCFTSESLGGRSANRGQCAQSCRFEYDLYVDGKKEQLGVSKYLVSPQDLCGVEQIPELLDIGVESFKVEGRLKSPEFVSSVAKAYRKSIDTKKIDSIDIDNMQVSYSRGFYSGWLNGVAHQELVEGSYASHRGLYLGEVLRSKNSEISLQTEIDLQRGDGLLLCLGEESDGEKIYDLRKNHKSSEYTLSLGPGIDSKFFVEGARVYLNRREKLFKELTQSYTVREKLKRIPIRVQIRAELNRPLSLTLLDGQEQVEVRTIGLCEKSLKSELSEESVVDQIKGLSHTPYIVCAVESKIESGLYINNRELKNLKKEFVEELNRRRVEINDYSFGKKREFHKREKKNQKSDLESKLNILIRKKEQLIDLVEYLKNIESKYKSQIHQVICDYEFGKDYFESIKIIRALGLKSCIATTRVLKPNEYHNFRLIERSAPDSILIRNLGALNYFNNSSFELYGDFSLNCANSETFKYLISKGLKSQTSSYDLNLKQLDSMMSYIDTSKLEITIHQYMPEFHMEHCVFAAFLSKGNSFRDCGKPCEKHEVHLTDMYGNRHEIKADQECRNTMFRSEVQSVVKFVEGWKNKGVGYFRFEALHEKGVDLISKVDAYLKLLAQDISVEDVYQKLGAIEKYGMSTGPLTRTREYESRKS